MLCDRGGRSVEVLRCGDPAGAPAIFMHGAKVYSFPTATEAAFRDAGLFYIIGRPGFGQSDPEPDSADRDQTIADDILAVLSQIGVEQAPFQKCFASPPKVLPLLLSGW